MNRKKRTLVITVVLLTLLIVPPFWITYREYRQARLDHALIAAIKAGDDWKALEALAEGASGEAMDTGEPPAFSGALLHLWDHFQHPGQKKEEHLPALLLLYERERMKPDLPGLDYMGPGPNLALVRSLLEHGAHVDDAYKSAKRDDNNNGMTPLHFACCYSNEETVRFLLEHGANIEAVDGATSSTPLMTAVFYKRYNTVRLLLEKRANSEAKDDSKETPLILAAVYGEFDAIPILLAHGAKVNARDFNGKSALDYMRGYSDMDNCQFIAILRHYGAK